jgi:hypothetical protein
MMAMTSAAAAADDLESRRCAELEFVESAYSTQEAWCDLTQVDCPRIHRTLHLLDKKDDDDAVGVLLLTLSLTTDYPAHVPLQVSGRVLETKNKRAYDALPHLIASCRKVAEQNRGEESVFLVLGHAEEWIAEEWPKMLLMMSPCNDEATTTSLAQDSQLESKTPVPVIFGRRLIYSHHIIAKSKRSAIKQLTASYKLTGYMKIGWPGLIIIEGAEEDCQQFYDEIRSMSWQYLVVRGEQQERVVDDDGELDLHRKFETFQETDDMSVFAEHCRSVGLEALFRTSMKLYVNSSEQENDLVAGESSSRCLVGALIHIDHMNDGKNYRKWLRKTADELNCLILIQFCYPNDDFSKRPLIIVGVVGDNDHVSSFMKRWRTRKVDLDSRGRPCLERQMTVLVEELLECSSTRLSNVDWDKLQSEGSHLNSSMENLHALLEQIGQHAWSDAFRQLIDRR